MLFFFPMPNVQDFCRALVCIEVILSHASRFRSARLRQLYLEQCPIQATPPHRRQRRAQLQHNHRQPHLHTLTEPTRTTHQRQEPTATPAHTKPASQATAGHIHTVMCHSTHRLRQQQQQRQRRCRRILQGHR